MYLWISSTTVRMQSCQTNIPLHTGPDTHSITHNPSIQLVDPIGFRMVTVAAIINAPHSLSRAAMGLHLHMASCAFNYNYVSNIHIHLYPCVQTQCTIRNVYRHSVLSIHEYTNQWIITIYRDRYWTEVSRDRTKLSFQTLKATFISIDRQCTQ